MGYFNSIYSSELPHRARAVYMYLKDRADKDGTCWPSIRTISRELGLSRATVCRALDDLCKAGLISREQRWRENGGKTSKPAECEYSRLRLRTLSVRRVKW